MLKDAPRPPGELNLTMDRVGEVFGGRPVGVLFVDDPLLADTVALRNEQMTALVSA